ncbi:MAG: adenylosuccinate synthase [Candidatus Peribacteraceae bacterium]
MQKLLSDLGTVTAIIGAQWGDEGKGKVTDILGEHFDVLARACGGANAGHTIVIAGKKHVFRLLPSGCLHPGKPVVLGTGMVIHLPTLLEEIEMLEKANIEIVHRLHISAAAHIVFDYHKELDAWQEEQKGKDSIGTTKRGIGPAYMDKIGRTGIRIGTPESEIKSALTTRAVSLKKETGLTMNVDHEMAEVARALKKVGSRIHASVPTLLHDFLSRKKSIVIEGAQATLLDIDHGTYPYVTSSSTTAAGALQGLGLAPRALSSCIGVVKAYCTRVGSGHFEAEEKGERGDRLRERGGEYGSITGRPRRCGWLSITDLKFSSMINGFTLLNLTKLDVLDEEEEIPVQDEHGTWQSLPGWKTSTVGITAWDKLPSAARTYIDWIEKAAGVPVRMIGTGPGREQMIVR